jgi:carboxyl-terminal processing protease
MLMPFKDNGRAIIVGERSKGSTGQTHARSYEEGIVVLIGIKRAYYPDGTPFEGRSITPNVAVVPTRECPYHQTDGALEQALELCQS